ncbi:unnamed protein product [Bubo scandiacus]
MRVSPCTPAAAEISNSEHPAPKSAALPWCWYWQGHLASLKLRHGYHPAQSCSYFTSNALPLKISFINANAPSGNINVIFNAIRNFFYSCAGCDNVMLTNAGHMFYIDFERFLGHTQTFGSIRRDRAPFIFTSEMEYFITEGGKNPQHFQEFVELCCRAYNIVRKHSYRLTIFLYFKMLHAGLPELNSIQDLKYMYDNLRTQTSRLQMEPVETGFGNSLSHSRHSMRKISPCQRLSCANMGIHIYDHFIFQRLPDGSAPSAHAEFYLLPDPYEVSQRKTRTAPKSSDPTYNEIVVYDKVTELKGHILKLVVKSKGAFMGALNIQLSSVQLNEEKWYPLGNSVI